MELVIEKREKVKQFSLLFHHLKCISENINILFTKNGLYAQGITGCHCSFFELNLSSDWFKEYSCEKDMTIGVNCELLFRCISCLSENQTINLFYDKSDKLKIVFSGDKTLTKKFEMPNLTIDTENLEVPEVDYSNDLKLSSDMFCNLINEMNIFSEQVQFKINREQINMISHSLTSGKMNITLLDDNILEWCCEEENDVDIHFALEYLKNMCLFSKLNSEVSIHISNDFPLKLTYNLSNWMDNIKDDEKDADENTDDIDENIIKFYLAPKIED